MSTPGGIDQKCLNNKQYKETYAESSAKHTQPF